MIPASSKENHEMKAQDAATVFGVSDVEKSIAFYTEVLGFTVDFNYGAYAGIRRDGVSLHLGQSSGPEVGRGKVYLMCDAVDDYYADVQSKGAEIKWAPKDYPYGRRDFEMTDPDGNSLAFSCEAKG
jgi:predicted enzyme related to lactoylglutathione lyase